MKLVVNGKEQTFDGDPTTPLLWVLRETLGLTGTKYGCGVAQCGACTVHVDGEAARACVTPVSAVAIARLRPLLNVASMSRVCTLGSAESCEISMPGEGGYSTVTDFARLRGWSTSVPLKSAT